MNYLKISLGIFIALAATRLIPHPPNFTSLIALSFYVPIFFGLRFIPAIIGSFLITDLILGFHNLQFFTWGSVLVIGWLSRYFTANFPNMIRLIAIINTSDRNKVNTRDNNLWLMIDLDSLTWYEALKASISEFIPLVEK